MSVEKFFIGFHGRLDESAKLDINEELKGHLLLGKQIEKVNTRILLLDSLETIARYRPYQLAFETHIELNNLQ